MQELYIPYELTCELVKRFDGNLLLQIISGELERYQLTSYDAYDVFSFSHVNIHVKLISHKGFKKKEGNEERESDHGVRVKWASIFTFNKRNHIYLHDVLKLITSEEMKENPGSLSKRLFVLYVFGFLLDPTAGRVVDMCLLTVVEDIDNIRNLNVCKFLVDRLGEVVIRWKKSGAYKKPHKCIGGCVLLLDVYYLHRYMYKGIKESPMLPLIQHWNSETLKMRLNGCDLDSCFGLAFLDHKTYPVSNEIYVVQCAQSSANPTRILPDTKSVGANGTRQLTFEIPDGIMTDGEIDNICDTGESKLLAILKRNVEVVTHHYINSLMDMRKEEEQQENIIRLAMHNPSAENDDDPYPFSPHPFDDWLRDLAVLSIIDQICLDFVNTTKKDLADEVPKFSLFDADVTPYASMLEKSKLSCTIPDLGPASVNVTYASELMSTFKREMMPLEELKKPVSDYCLFQDLENNGGSDEQLVVYTDVYGVPKEEMACLNVSQTIFVSIIDYWALMLNYVEQKIGGSALRKFCFGTGIFILVPLHFENHFTLYVINFGKKKVQYPDNLVYDKVTVNRFHKSLVSEMSFVFGEMYHSKAKEMLDYEFEYVTQYGDNAGFDCGVFLMKKHGDLPGRNVYMQQFDECNCYQKDSHTRRRLCYSCTCWHNETRTELLEKVNEFEKGKPEVIQRVKAIKASKEEGR